MPKKATYVPLSYEDPKFVLESSGAYAQAAQALDVLYQEAKAAGDRERMSDVCAMWIRMGETLGSADSEPEGHEFPSKDNGRSSGFTLDTKEEEIDRDEGQREDESTSESRIHNQHGRL